MPALAQPTAELWNTVFNVVLVLGAIAVLAGTWGAFWTGNMKEFYANARISANEATTATANATAETARANAAQANERAALANGEAARANERASQLEKNVADAKIEQEQLRVRGRELELQIARLGPRKLDDDLSEKIKNFAATLNYKPMITISYIVNNEVVKYVTQLATALRNAGFVVNKGETAMMGFPQGVAVYDQTGTMQKLMSSIGIKYNNTMPIPDFSGAQIIVGDKPLE